MSTLYHNGDEVDADDINTAIQQAEEAFKLTQPIDNTDISNVSLPRALIIDTNTGGLKANNLIGDPGQTGNPPAHEWQGTSLRFENPDATWGSLVDLKGESGGTRVISVSGNTLPRLDLNDIFINGNGKGDESNDPVPRLEWHEIASDVDGVNGSAGDDFAVPLGINTTDNIRIYINLFADFLGTLVELDLYIPITYRFSPTTLMGVASIDLLRIEGIDSVIQIRLYYNTDNPSESSWDAGIYGVASGTTLPLPIHINSIKIAKGENQHDT